MQATKYVVELAEDVVLRLGSLYYTDAAKYIGLIKHYGVRCSHTTCVEGIGWDTPMRVTPTQMGKINKMLSGQVYFRWRMQDEVQNHGS